MQIQHRHLDIETAGVQAALASDPAQAETVVSILGADAAALAPVMDYAVVVTNHSAQPLRAIAVYFQWPGDPSQIPPPGKILVLTALQINDVGKLGVEEAQMMTPTQALNQYLRVAPDRRAAFLGQAQLHIGSSAGPAPQSIGSIVATAMNGLSGAAGMQVSIEGIVFDDFRYVGGNSVLPTLQKINPNIHR